MLRNVEQAGGRDTFLTLEINHLPPRNRGIKAEKPATESTVAQESQEYEELSFPEQKV